MQFVWDSAYRWTCLKQPITQCKDARVWEVRWVNHTVQNSEIKIFLFFIYLTLHAFGAFLAISFSIYSLKTLL